MHPGWRILHRIAAPAVLLALFLAPATMARADRHCSPILSRYYGARTALHDSVDSCESRLSAALRLLSWAADEARACGCFAVDNLLQPYLEDGTGEGASTCEENVRAILGLDATLSQMVDECNF